MKHFDFLRYTLLERSELILALLLLLSLLPMPYGYYSIVRLLTFVVFGYKAYREYKASSTGNAVFYGTVALLFQPFMKICLERELWNVIDVIIAVLLIIPFAKQIRK